MPIRNTVYSLFLCCIALLPAASFGADLPAPPIPIGTKVTSLRFIDIRGLDRNLRELGDYQAVVFVFTTKSCPLVRKSFPKLVALYEAYRERKVVFVAVNAGPEDTVREMAAQAVDFQVPFFFVKDADHSAVQSLGVQRTPEVVLLDHENTIRYRGRIDDQLRIGGTRPQATREDLKEAIEEVLAGKPVSVPETEVDGCLITQIADKEPAPSDVTWSSEIASLVHDKCSRCHREGTAAPFPLLTYDDVASHAEMIAHVVRLETMPPWYASRAHGTFQNDTSMSPAQIDRLCDWITAGCPEGNPQQAPLPPKSEETEWRIGKPDLVIQTVEEHAVPATGFVPYQYAVLPYVFFGETWVEAFEIQPLNPSVVHHCNLAYITKDGASEETFITGYVPGGQPMDLGQFDNGVAYRIPAGAVLGLQIHYTTTGREETGGIRVGLRFPRRDIRKRLYHFLLDPRGWKIPPADPAFRIEASYTLPRNANLLGLFTHMHVRGRDMTFFATKNGTAEEVLLQIPNYNFEWQLGYELAPGKVRLPQGTKVRAAAHYDNSAFNPYNPDPQASVEYGPQTVDEMFNGFVFYVDEDENLDIHVDPQNGRPIKN